MRNIFEKFGREDQNPGGGCGTHPPLGVRRWIFTLGICGLRPSGRNSLSRRRFHGSLQEGIVALSSALQNKSFSCWWWARRPVPSLRERPWVPMQSTHAPHLPVRKGECRVANQSLHVRPHHRGVARIKRPAARAANRHCAVMTQQ